MVAPTINGLPVAYHHAIGVDIINSIGIVYHQGSALHISAPTNTSPRTADASPFIIHYSLFIIHYSLFIMAPRATSPRPSDQRFAQGDIKKRVIR